MSSSLSTDIDDLESFKHSGKAFLNKFSRELSFSAKAMTLTSVLDASKSPDKIDFMSLDVEGAELAVLSGLDFSKYKIKYILVYCHATRSFSKRKNETSNLLLG